jgi:hypothetical protein
VSHLSQAATAEEACAAAVGIGERLVGEDPAAVVAAMQAVLKGTSNAGILQRARRLLAKARQATAQ